MQFVFFATNRNYDYGGLLTARPDDERKLDVFFELVYGSSLIIEDYNITQRYALHHNKDNGSSRSPTLAVFAACLMSMLAPEPLWEVLFFCRCAVQA